MSLLETGSLDHVAVAVHDLDEALSLYGDLLGAEVAYREEVEGQGVEVAFLDLPGESRLELVAALGEGTPVGRFLERRGPGLHHVCFRVPDLERALRRLDDAGVPLVDRRPRRGARGSRIAFVRPDAFGGVLVELKEAGG